MPARGVLDHVQYCCQSQQHLDSIASLFSVSSVNTGPSPLDPGLSARRHTRFPSRYQLLNRFLVIPSNNTKTDTPMQGYHRLPPTISAFPQIRYVDTYREVRPSCSACHRVSGSQGAMAPSVRLPDDPGGRDSDSVLVLCLSRALRSGAVPRPLPPPKSRVWRSRCSTVCGVRRRFLTAISSRFPCRYRLFCPPANGQHEWPARQPPTFVTDKYLFRVKPPKRYSYVRLDAALRPLRQVGGPSLSILSDISVCEEPLRTASERELAGLTILAGLVVSGWCAPLPCSCRDTALEHP